MDITGIRTQVPDVSTNQLVNAASTAVLSKSLDTQETMGKEMVQMMEQSVNPNLGTQFDARV